MTSLLDNIKNLREITGAGFLDCKKALETNNNDIDESISFLRKKGLAKASKKLSRTANEGAIGIFLNQESAIMIEINTETDFAAKNETFLEFFNDIGKYALNFSKSNNMSIENFLDYAENGKKITSYITDIISKIGENIILRKILLYKIEPKTNVYYYVHNSYRPNIGKICVLLQASVDIDNEQTKEFGKNLCMHIAASKPIALNVDNLDQNLIEKEKDIQLATIKSSGKPENIINKILDGKMKKYYSEATLMNQHYIFDTDKTVKEIISEKYSNDSFKILKYELFVLGSV